MAKYCAWCNRYIGENDKYWYKNINENGKTYKSNEVFCSQKCLYEYPFPVTPKRGSKGCLWIVIIIIIIALVVMANLE